MTEIIQQLSVNIEMPIIFNLDAIAFHMYSGLERMIDHTLVNAGGKLIEHTNDERISAHNIVWIRIRIRRGFYEHIIKERNTHKG